MDPGDQPAHTISASIYTTITGTLHGVHTLALVLEIYGRDIRSIRKMHTVTYLSSVSFFFFLEGKKKILARPGAGYKNIGGNTWRLSVRMSTVATNATCTTT